MLPTETAKTMLCKVTSCYRDAGGPMCDHHRRMIATDLTWLADNLRDLTAYRLNRAYGAKGEGGTVRATAPAPLRETLYDLLWSESDDGMPSLQSTLYELARSLGCPVKWDMPMNQLARYAHDSPNLPTCSATPVYVPLVHALTSRLRRFVASADMDMVVYGACPAPGCGNQLSALPHAEHVKCRKCGSEWTATHLRLLRWQRIFNADALGTPTQLVQWLAWEGLVVKPATLRSWVHRGQLVQAGEDSYSHPLYRLKQAYTLATRNMRKPGHTNNSDQTVWKPNNTRKGNSNE